MITILRLGLACFLGFFLPGALISRLLRCPEQFISSFLISIVLLFHTIFWLDLFSVRLSFHAPLLILLCLSLGLTAFLQKQRIDPSGYLQTDFPRSLLEKTMIAGIGVILILFVIRSFLSPLLGFDTYFRWNFLPQQMLRFGNFDFYPPLGPQDFKKYFYVDGIPPIIQFSYWWLYAAAGAVRNSLTGIIVSLQFVLILLVTFKLGKELSSRTGGLLAAVFLICSPLFFWSVFMGQETGMTSLSLVSMIYFLLLAKKMDRGSLVIIAAFAGAAGGLAREYACGFVLCGIVSACWFRLPIRQIAVFFVISIALMAPWYVRNWIIAGNPFYSNPVGDFFKINPVHVAILNTYGSVLGLNEGTLSKVEQNLQILLEYAPLQLTLGLLGALILIRRFGYLLISAITVILLWIVSIGKTAGGYFWAMRVLSPALILFSILSAILLAGRVQQKSWRRVTMISLVGLLAYSFTYELVIPFEPQSLPLSQWFHIAFHGNRAEADELKAKLMAPYLKKMDCRILSDDTYLHAALFPYGIELVPVWSPEVSFLFDPNEDPDKAQQKLIALNIKAVLYSPESLNNLYLSRFAFFSRGRKQWTRYLKAPSSEVYRLTGN